MKTSLRLLTPFQELPPLIRWVGSREALAPTLAPAILAKLEPRRGRYFEPFLGSAAVFLRLRANGWSGPAVLSDALSPLIHTYRFLQLYKAPALLRRRLDELERLGPYSECYDHVCRRLNEHMKGVSMPTIEVAACFLYLNRCARNGLWRVSVRGQMEVPFGGLASLPGVDELGALARALIGAELRACDFEKVLAEARRGDVVYADPPQVGGFSEYAPGGFPGADQVRLRDSLLAAWERGATILCSNAHHPFVLELYGREPFSISIHKTRHSSCGRGHRRAQVTEALIVACQTEGEGARAPGVSFRR